MTDRTVFFMIHDWERLTPEEAVECIIHKANWIRSKWQSCNGWAPQEAAAILKESRLDWLVSFACSLRQCLDPFESHERSCRVILGYAKIGALIEGAIKTYLTVWLKPTRTHAVAHFGEERARKIGDPHHWNLETLRVFCDAVPWRNFKEVMNKCPFERGWAEWIRHIQVRRNAVHAFKDRDIGTQDELLVDLRALAVFFCFTLEFFPDEPPSSANPYLPIYGEADL